MPIQPNVSVNGEMDEGWYKSIVYSLIHVAKGIISSLHETVAKANRYQSSSIPEKWGNRKEHLQKHLFKVVRLMVIVKRVMLIAWYWKSYNKRKGKVEI